MQRWESAPDGGWERVLLKLSGEAFSGGTGLGVDPDVPWSKLPDEHKKLILFGNTPSEEQAEKRAKKRGALAYEGIVPRLEARLGDSAPTADPEDDGGSPAAAGPR